MRGRLVDVSIEGSVACLTLTRPEARNALSVELCNAIVEGLQKIEEDTGSRVLLLRGEGSVFCSGADFAAVSGPGGLDFLPAFEEMLEAVGRFRLPVVAAIQGAALGGGLQLATVCDFRVVSESAKIGIPSSRLGIVVNYENVRRLVLMTGLPVAKEVLMTGRVYSGAEAAAAGLVTKAVPEDSLDLEARRLCERLASNAPLSVQGAKRSIQVVADDLSNGRQRDPLAVGEVDRLVIEAYNSSDLAEGIRALSEKRPPEFEGR
ncbi:MAG: enoyl-CoA hydratase-related protein [Actinomycetota bacterium]|nr:enoyl-CoA hydratase-related protein [Actinomycetota bacterium]